MIANQCMYDVQVKTLITNCIQFIFVKLKSAPQCMCDVDCIRKVSMHFHVICLHQTHLTDANIPIDSFNYQNDSQTNVKFNSLPRLLSFYLNPLRLYYWKQHEKQKFTSSWTTNAVLVPIHIRFSNRKSNNATLLTKIFRIQFIWHIQQLDKMQVNCSHLQFY